MMGLSFGTVNVFRPKDVLIFVFDITTALNRKYHVKIAARPQSPLHAACSGTFSFFTSFLSYTQLLQANGVVR